MVGYAFSPNMNPALRMVTMREPFPGESIFLRNCPILTWITLVLRGTRFRHTPSINIAGVTNTPGRRKKNSSNLNSRARKITPFPARLTVRPIKSISISANRSLATEMSSSRRAKAPIRATTSEIGDSAPNSDRRTRPAGLWGLEMKSTGASTPCSRILLAIGAHS